MYKNVHMHITRINKKGHEFEGEKEGVCGKVWREKMEGGNYGIILPSQIIIK